MALFIPESPRYLYSKKNWKELHKNLRYIAKANRKGSKFQTKDLFSDPTLPINHERRNRSNTNSRQSKDLNGIAMNCKNRVHEYSIMTALKDKTTLTNLITII